MSTETYHSETPEISRYEDPLTYSEKAFAEELASEKESKQFETIDEARKWMAEILRETPPTVFSHGLRKPIPIPSRMAVHDGQYEDGPEHEIMVSIPGHEERQKLLDYGIEAVASWSKSNFYDHAWDREKKKAQFDSIETSSEVTFPDEAGGLYTINSHFATVTYTVNPGTAAEYREEMNLWGDRLDTGRFRKKYKDLMLIQQRIYNAPLDGTDENTGQKWTTWTTNASLKHRKDIDDAQQEELKSHYLEMTSAARAAWDRLMTLMNGEVAPEVLRGTRAEIAESQELDLIAASMKELAKHRRLSKESLQTVMEAGAWAGRFHEFIERAWNTDENGKQRTLKNIKIKPGRYQKLHAIEAKTDEMWTRFGADLLERGVIITDKYDQVEGHVGTARIPDDLGNIYTIGNRSVTYTTNAGTKKENTETIVYDRLGFFYKPPTMRWTLNGTPVDQ